MALNLKDSAYPKKKLAPPLPNNSDILGLPPLQGPSELLGRGGEKVQQWECKF